MDSLKILSIDWKIWVAVALALTFLVAFGVWWYKTHIYPYHHPPAPIKKVKEMFRAVAPNIGDIPIREGGESYTMNKSSITLCLRDPDTKRIYPWNTLAYVSLHELAHVITRIKERDVHGPQFKKNFKMLLKRAEKLGYYDPSLGVSDTYCGT